MKKLSITVFSFFFLILTISAMNYKINSISPTCGSVITKGSKFCCSIELESTNKKTTNFNTCEKNCCAI